jgi:hypothetical protein
VCSTSARCASVGGEHAILYADRRTARAGTPEPLRGVDVGADRTKIGRRRSLRQDIDVPTFLHASDAEIRASVVDTFVRAWQLCETLYVVACNTPSGTDEWNHLVARADRLEDALSVDGWAGVRRARMLLLSAIDDAVNHAARVEKHRVTYDLARAAWDRPAETWTDAEKEAIRRVGLVVPTWLETRNFETVTDGKLAHEDVALFAAFLFFKRCNRYARGLVSTGAMPALRVVIDVWTRRPGRPRGSAKALRAVPKPKTVPKFDACDSLMKLAGLLGSTAETLEKDWQEWKRTHERKRQLDGE